VTNLRERLSERCTSNAVRGLRINGGVFSDCHPLNTENIIQEDIKVRNALVTLRCEVSRDEC